MRLSARPYSLLVLLCLALYLPGLAGLPPTDRDESRYAQASKQMLESGDYIRIQFQGESRAKKPAGIYWLQAASATLTGAKDAIWAYRLPSAIGATIAVLLTFLFGQTLLGRPKALIAAALLACSVQLVIEAHQAKTDAVLLACAVLAQGVLAKFYCARQGERPGFGWAMLFWLAQGLGILIKPPLLPVMSLLTIAALWIADRRIGWAAALRPLPGLLLVALLVAPWAWAISHATAGQFIGQAVKNDLLPKLFGAQESHGAPPGTYLLLLPVFLWPASLLVFPALPHAFRHRKEDAFRFLLAWILPTWLLLEATPTKLPNYALPLYPALTLVAAAWIGEASPRLWQKAFGLLPGLIGTVLAAALVAAPLAVKLPPDWGLLPISLAILPLVWAPVLALWYGRTGRAAAFAVAAAVIGYGAIFTLLPERLMPMWVSRQISAQVPAGAALASAGYAEPSLVFLHGTDTLLTDGAGAADFLAQHPEGWAAVEQSEQAAFDTHMGDRAIAAGHIDGFNAVRGRPAHITLWRLTR